MGLLPVVAVNASDTMARSAPHHRSPPTEVFRTCDPGSVRTAAGSWVLTLIRAADTDRIGTRLTLDNVVSDAHHVLATHRRKTRRLTPATWCAGTLRCPRIVSDRGDNRLAIGSANCEPFPQVIGRIEGLPVPTSDSVRILDRNATTGGVRNGGPIPSWRAAQCGTRPGRLPRLEPVWARTASGRPANSLASAPDSIRLKRHVVPVTRAVCKIAYLHTCFFPQIPVSPELTSFKHWFSTLATHAQPSDENVAPW